MKEIKSEFVDRSSIYTYILILYENMCSGCILQYGVVMRAFDYLCFQSKQ